MDKSCTGKPRIRSPFQVTISLLSITPSTNTKVNTEAEGAAAAGQKFLMSFLVNDESRRNKMDLKKRKCTLHH